MKQLPLPYDRPRLTHHCHALGCRVPTARRLLMCGPHWARVPADLQAEVYRTVRLRVGGAVDATWAPWWRAAHRAIAHVGTLEGLDTTAYLARELELADRLEGRTARVVL